MGMHVPYSRTTYRPGDDILPGNKTSDNPLEFDIVPAWGGDLARIKSLIYATMGLVQGKEWGPQVQEAVIAAFDTGAPVFENTVTAIRGLSVPSIMALRAGLIPALPKTVQDGGMKSDPEAPYEVMNGRAFSKLCGALAGTALHVAMEIGKLSDKAEQAMDPRFFKQPSGSSGTAKAGRGKGSTVATARPTSRRRGTAASDSTAAGK